MADGVAGSSSSYIKVTTEELQTKAGAAEDALGTLDTCFQEIAGLMEKTGSYWVGEAGDLYRSTYKTQNETVQEILKRLKEYPGKLLTMAGVYEPAESAGVEAASSLKTDLL